MDSPGDDSSLALNPRMISSPFRPVLSPGVLEAGPPGSEKAVRAAPDEIEQGIVGFQPGPLPDYFAGPQVQVRVLFQEEMGFDLALDADLAADRAGRLHIDEGICTAWFGGGLPVRLFSHIARFLYKNEVINTVYST